MKVELLTQETRRQNYMAKIKNSPLLTEHAQWWADKVLEKDSNNKYALYVQCLNQMASGNNNPELIQHITNMKMKYDVLYQLKWDPHIMNNIQYDLDMEQEFVDMFSNVHINPDTILMRNKGNKANVMKMLIERINKLKFNNCVIRIGDVITMSQAEKICMRCENVTIHNDWFLTSKRKERTEKILKLSDKIAEKGVNVNLALRYSDSFFVSKYTMHKKLNVRCSYEIGTPYFYRHQFPIRFYIEHSTLKVLIMSDTRISEINDPEMETLKNLFDVVQFVSYNKESDVVTERAYNYFNSFVK